MGEQEKPLPSTEEIKVMTAHPGMDLAGFVIGALPIGIGIDMINEGGILVKVGGGLFVILGLVIVALAIWKMKKMMNLTPRVFEEDARKRRAEKAQEGETPS